MGEASAFRAGRKPYKAIYRKDKSMAGKVKMEAKQPKENKSFIISASLQKGCYRHIQIAQDATLDDTMIEKYEPARLMGKWWRV